MVCAGQRAREELLLEKGFGLGVGIAQALQVIQVVFAP
jgi:hypothetical protein